MILLAIYLVFFKGYSIIKFDDQNLGTNQGKRYGSCDSGLGYDYTHNGNWGRGDTPVQAVISSWRKK